MNSEDRCELLCVDLPRAEELRRARPPAYVSERVASLAAALADPTRLELVGALREGEELCVCDLAWIAERSQNLVSHHLRVLRTSGLVAARRDRKMVMYRLTDAGQRLFDAVVSTAGEPSV